MEILDRLKEILNESDYPVMIELGACDFYHSRVFLNILDSLNKNYKLYSFEPTSLFEKHIKCKYQNGSFKPIKKAIGQIDDRIKLYVSGGKKYDNNGNVLDHYYGSSSIRKPKDVLTYWPEMKFEESETESRWNEHIEL